jgi:hypothetical protein
VTTAHPLRQQARRAAAMAALCDVFNVAPGPGCYLP